MKQDIALRGVELVAVGQASILKGQKRVTGCAACSHSASQPFQRVLGEVLGTGHGIEYVLTSSAECPRCGSPLFETTLVSTEGLSKSLPISAEDQVVVFINKDTLTEAEGFLAACEHCQPVRAEVGFDQVLDSITGCDPTVTEYVICHAARCPNCRHEVTEKTLVVPA